ncbi:MAG: hypothetical protein HRU09_16715 [Oligoflexales bacterium]|nr:hypothetical protein [Oligoflexales bacterium]
MEPRALRANLRKALLEYRQKRPNLSLRAIARNSGVNRYFLNKLLEEQKENDNTALDLNQVLLFSKFLTKKSSVQEIIEHSSDEVKEALKTTLLVKPDSVVLPECSDDLNLYDENTFIILHLAGCDHGTDKVSIQKILGDSGLRTLKELIDSEQVIEKQDGRIELRNKDDFTYSSKIIRQQIGNLVKYFDPNHLGNKRNCISLAVQSVNKEALAEIHKIHEEAYKKIDKLIKNKKSRGNIPCFSFSCLDTFIDELPSQ